MTRASKAALFWLFLTCLKLGCQTANHYCTNNVISPLKVDEVQNRDETIIPAILGETDDGRLQYRSCIWRIESAAKSNDLQLVLKGVPMDSIADGSLQPKSDKKSSTDMVISYSRGKIPVKTGMLLVLPISQLLPFTVEASWHPRSQSASRVKLRLLLILPGLCDRDMLSFNRSCYAVSELRANLTAAMSDIGGDAQLASFSSMAEIDSLIAANKARELVHPYRRPLILSQPVRLGLFYRAVDAAVLSIFRNSSGACGLEPVANPEIFIGSDSVTGWCSTLKVDASDKALIEFSGCSSQMLVLIKFPESRSSASLYESCGTRTVIPIISEILRQTTKITTESTEPVRTSSPSPTTQPQGLRVSSANLSVNYSPESPESNTPMIVGVTCGIFAVIIFIVIITAVYVYKRKNRSTQQATKEESDIPVRESEASVPLIVDVDEPLPDTSRDVQSDNLSKAVPDAEPVAAPTRKSVLANDTPHENLQYSPRISVDSLGFRSHPSYSSNQMDNKPEEFQSPDPNQAGNFEPEMFQSLDPNQAGNSEPEVFQSLDPNQAGNFKPEVFQSLDPDQAGNFEPEVFQSLDPDQAGNFEPEVFQSLDPNQAGNFEPEVFQSLDPDQAGNFEPEVFHSLAPDQTGNLESEEFHSLAPNQMDDMESEEFQSLAPNQMDDMELEEFQSLAPNQMDDMESEEFQSLAANQMDDMESEEFQSLAPN